MKLSQTKLKIGLATVLCFWVAVNGMPAKELTLDDIFPTDRVLDVQITVANKDWDTIRHQSRDFFSALHESRKVAPIDAPYTYVNASVTIDGVAFPEVGLRKKGFLGSQSTTRPSLKIKLNHTDKNAGIEGLTNLTFNNNQQDVSLVSQFMGYALFNAAGSPAPRCAYAKVTVNGVNLGVYSHVETVRKSFLKRAFGNDDGTLHEGPYVDFYEGWVGSFERKTGKDTPGRQKIQQLIEVLESDDENIEEAIGELVKLDAFYAFWAVEGLLGFWDGYSGNNNNFFIYLNPETNKFHFLPWGADSLFIKFSKLKYDPRAPISVKTQGLIAHKLYQLESGRERYAQTLMDIIEKHWNEAELLAEIDRIETMVTPHLVQSQLFFSDKEKQKGERGTFAQSLEATREFIRQRRADITKEIAHGMPEWKKAPSEPFVIGADAKFKPKANSIWSAAQTGNTKAILQHLAVGADVNAKDSKFGVTPLAWATLLGQTKTVELLIQKGADVNAGNKDGETPLHIATFLGQYEIAELLIQKGADLDAKNNRGETPVNSLKADWATTRFIAGLLQIKVNREKVQTGRTQIVELFRQHGVQTGSTDVNPFGNDICTATRAGNIKAIKQQLAKGADVNTGDSEFGVSPLSWAALLGHTEIAELLIQSGADVNGRNRDGGTALHGATFLGHVDAAELLIRNGADVNAKNDKGETPLYVSTVGWEITEFVAALLEIEVDEKRVKTGRTRIVDILRQHGAKHGASK